MSEQTYRDVLSRLEAKDKKPMTIDEAYDALSFLPGTGEAIAAYELPGILSQAKTLMQDPDYKKALLGLGLGALGTAAVAPGIGPVARYAKKGIEDFIPYLGPKPAAEGVDTSILMAGFGKDPTKVTPGKVPDIEKARELGQEELFPSAVKKEDDVEDLIYATKDVKGEKADDVFTFGPGSLFDPAEKKGRKLLIVSCSETKCPDDKDMKAIDRYLGPVFQTLKAQGIPENVDVAIMSAKHGLIRSNTPLKNYNEKMTKAKAQAFKNDPDQLNRIRNTMMGYDKVIVQGGEDYKDVLRTAAGDLKINEIPGGRGIGDQREFVMNAINPFRKIKTPVYHFSKNTDPGFTKFDTKKLSWFDLGPHVGSTPKAAQDRFLDETFGVGARLQIRKKMQELNVDRDEAIDSMLRSGELEVPLVTGNVGYNKFNMPIPRKTLGGSIPLKADLSKPLLNPDTKKPFTENQLMEYQAEKYSEARGKNFTADDILSEDPDVDIGDVKMFMRKFAKDLAEQGYTHIPYLNAVEDTKNLSYIMLVDRPKGKTKVLQSPFAKKDEEAFDDPDFMKAEGGVVEMKDKAVNMYRGTQGIEPFIKYMV